MNKLYNIIIVLLILHTSCKDRSENSNISAFNDNTKCNCSDLILDELYNHFYLSERTKPFSGICEEYHKNKNLAIVKEFTEGKMEGEMLEYSKKGILIKKWRFHDNKMNGEAISFDTTGKITFHGIYKNGKLDSTIITHQ